MLRLRSDEQLVALFRDGHDEAFRVIHDRYRQRLFAYTRQMLPGRQDAEDALQDVFVRAYSNLRANDRELALRAWLYRVAHNRCVDELRRPAPPPPEAMQFIASPIQDPIAQADQRESLRRLVEDVRRLPAQQRSSLLMRELGGMPYADLAAALGVSVPAVKSLLVRARIALAQAIEARETACSDIREELILAHDRRSRPNANARRHLRDCPGCRQFRGEMRGMSRQLAALVPAIGPLGVAAKVLGLGGGAGGSAAAGSGGAAAAAGSSGAAAAAGSSSAVASVGAFAASAGHVATLIAATVVTAGGAVEIQHTITQPARAHHRHVHHAQLAAAISGAALLQGPSGSSSAPAASQPPSAPASHASSGSTAAAIAAASAPPLRVITGTAVKKVSSVVSTTTKDATTKVKSSGAAKGVSGRKTSSSSADPAAAASSDATSTTAAGDGATTGTATGKSAGTQSASTDAGGSGTAGASATGTTSAPAADATGSAGTGTTGASDTGSGTS